MLKRIKAKISELGSFRMAINGEHATMVVELIVGE
jgi:hypothetical protein